MSTASDRRTGPTGIRAADGAPDAALAQLNARIEDASEVASQNGLESLLEISRVANLTFDAAARPRPAVPREVPSESRATPMPHPWPDWIGTVPYVATHSVAPSAPVVFPIPEPPRRCRPPRPPWEPVSTSKGGAA